MARQTNRRVCALSVGLALLLGEGGSLVAYGKQTGSAVDMTGRSDVLRDLRSRETQHASPRLWRETDRPLRSGRVGGSQEQDRKNAILRLPVGAEQPAQAPPAPFQDARKIDPLSRAWWIVFGYLLLGFCADFCRAAYRRRLSPREIAGRVWFAFCCLVVALFLWATVVPLVIATIVGVFRDYLIPR